MQAEPGRASMAEQVAWADQKRTGFARWALWETPFSRYVRSAPSHPRKPLFEWKLRGRR